MRTAAVEPIHTPFVRIAELSGMSLLSAIVHHHRTQGRPISYNGMIGEIEGPKEGNLFEFRCPQAGFEDYVPADALCLVTMQSEEVCA